MAEVHGKDASVSYTNVTAGMDSWEVTYTDELVEITDFADAGVAAFILGKTHWEAQMSGNWDAANTAKPGDAAATWTGTADTGDTYAGSAFIRSMTVTAPHDNKITTTYNMQGTGVLTITL